MGSDPLVGRPVIAPAPSIWFPSYQAAPSQSWPGKDHWWKWLKHGVPSFTPVGVQYPLENKTAKLFRLLCDTIVANFPAILHRPDELGHVRSYNMPADSEHAWFLLHHGQQLQHRINDMEADTTPLRNQQDLHRLVKLPGPTDTLQPAFENQPELVRLITVWNGSAPWSPSKKQCSTYTRAVSRADGIRARDDRLGRRGQEDEAIASALATIDWKDAARTHGLSTYDHEFWYKTRLGAFSQWNPSTQSQGCPYPTCTTDTTVGMSHVMWDCPRATALWSRVLTKWGAVDQGTDHAQYFVFARDPPVSTYNWNSMLGVSDARGSNARLAYWLQVSWDQLVTSTARLLWQRRTRQAFHDDAAPETGDFFALEQKWRQQLLATLDNIVQSRSETREDDLHIQRTLCSRWGHSKEEATHYDLSGGDHLLFFDGGSRGNPGPGGSGAVIIQVGATPATSSLIWACSMSFAATTTTNNTAEYEGLRHGLAAAAHHGWHPLTVVGDSQLIIRQMRTRRPPKAPQLLPLYQAARHSADQIVVKAWVHHYREFNKMADHAANLAMDTRKSFQTTRTSGRAELDLLDTNLHNDLLHWFETQAGIAQAPHRPTRPRTG